MNKSIITIVLFIFSLILVSHSWARYESGFEVITFKPATDSGDYFTQYGSQNLKAWQGVLGIYWDYANRPLQFVATGPAVGRQSVIDHWIIGNMYGALGFTDWFEVGMNIPVVYYNWFFVDDATVAEDHGGGLGDIQFNLKFRAVNTENSKVGLSFMPFVTIPSGDVERYTGNGHVTGGLMLITDFLFHERFNMALNVGANLRDDVTKHAVQIDDQFIYGAAANIKFTQNFHGILEAFGRTTMKNFFQNSGESPFEAGGGIRYLFGDSGFGLDLGGTAGIIDGIGAPRFRGFLGLKWTSPISTACPECAPELPPDPRIQGDIIKIWGKIFFDTDKATIKPISFPVLDDVVDVMQKNPQLTMVEVQGHCDIRGGYQYNINLSQRRSESVVDYLVSKGIDRNRLTGKGYGYTVPIADNNTKEGMSQNRRVEFHILSRSDR